MINSSVKIGAAGAFSQWIPVNGAQNPFSVSLSTNLDPTSVLTYSIQHTFDNPQILFPVANASRVTTVATLTLVNHGAVVGDTVLVQGAGAPFDGYFNVATVVDANNLTYTVADAGPTSAFLDVRASICRVFPHASLVAQTTNKDGNYAFPIAATRIIITAFTSGAVAFTVKQGS